MSHKRISHNRFRRSWARRVACLLVQPNGLFFLRSFCSTVWSSTLERSYTGRWKVDSIYTLAHQAVDLSEIGKVDFKISSAFERFQTSPQLWWSPTTRRTTRHNPLDRVRSAVNKLNLQTLIYKSPGDTMRTRVGELKLPPWRCRMSKIGLEPSERLQTAALKLNFGELHMHKSEFLIMCGYWARNNRVSHEIRSTGCQVSTRGAIGRCAPSPVKRTIEQEPQEQRTANSRTKNQTSKLEVRN